MSYLSIEYIEEAQRNIIALQREYESVKASITNSWQGDASVEALRLAEQNIAVMMYLDRQMGLLSSAITKAMQELEESAEQDIEEEQTCFETA